MNRNKKKLSRKKDNTWNSIIPRKNRIDVKCKETQMGQKSDKILQMKTNKTFKNFWKLS